MTIVTIFIGIVLLLAAPPASAADILDTIASTYQTASSGWFSKLQGYATSLFWLLAAIELAWAAITWALEKDAMTTFMAAFIKKIMGISFFYALLLYASTWIPAIINSFQTAGKTAGGFSGAGITPSSVIDLGISTAAQMLEKIKDMSLLDSPMTIVVAGLSALGMVIAFTIIAAQLMIALIESYIIIGAGVLFLGFGGSRFTTDFAHKYICYAFANGVKLFMLYLILAIGMAQAETWGTLLSTTQLNNIFAVLGASLVLAFLSFQIPGLAASMLSGAPSLTAGSAAQSMAIMAAGALTAGAAVTSPVVNEARGGVRALTAGYGTAREIGSGPISSSIKGLGYAAHAMGTETIRGVGAAVGLTKPSEFATGAKSFGERAANRLDSKSQIFREQRAAMDMEAGPSVSTFGSPGGDMGLVTPITPSSSGNLPSSCVPSTVMLGSATETSAVTGSTTGAGSPGSSPIQPAGGKRSGLRRVNPPQFPNDQPPPATVTIKLQHPED
jgi:type IV secretion system protein TrbL